MEADKEYGGFFRNELTINDIQAAMENREVTSKEEILNPTLYY